MTDQHDMPSSFPSQPPDHFDQNSWEFIQAPNEAHLPGLEQNESPRQLTSTKVKRSTSDASTGSASSGRKIRGPFKTVQARTETGMCVINEDDREGICQKCLVLAEPLSRVPCIRDKITDATVFLEMAAPDPRKTSRWKTMKAINITTWKSTDRRTVEWTQGVGTTACKLKVREFQPLEGDALDRTWTVAGVKRRKPCPTFAIEDMAAAAVNVIPWFDSSVVAYVKKGLNHDDRLIHSHYAFAYKISQEIAGDDGRQDERKLLRNVLRLWAAARTNTETDLLTGSELLGMKPDSDDPFSPYFERIPTPPVMAVQLQIILWCSILVPLKRQVLSQLQTLIMANKTQSWLTIYLCLFMFLHSCALITKGDYNYARKHAMKKMYAEPGVLEGLHHGATTMLAYFHYRNKGDLPFKFNSEKSDWVDLGGLDDEAKRFIEYAFEEVRRRKSEIEGVREKKVYHDDLFFVSQMFDTDWKPVVTEPFVAFEE
ncbi:hypothetical protein IFR05_003191 [Cadophora sp. M221]|nr:hypothetical protein IFR05_003191 [Cadophora sp. M221]